MREKPCQSPGRMKNSSYYIAPVGVRTHDLPHTAASNMVKVSQTLTTRPRLKLHWLHLSVPTYSYMICSDISQFVICFNRPVFSINYIYLPLDEFSWVRYVTMYSGGSESEIDGEYFGNVGAKCDAESWSANV